MWRHILTLRMMRQMISARIILKKSKLNAQKLSNKLITFWTKRFWAKLLEKVLKL
jgi:hypothetical protein